MRRMPTTARPMSRRHTAAPAVCPHHRVRARRPMLQPLCCDMTCSSAAYRALAMPLQVYHWHMLLEHVVPFAHTTLDALHGVASE